MLCNVSSSNFLLYPVFHFQASSGPQSNTWFTKTLSSIKEVAGAKTTKSGQPLQSPTDVIKKSSSEQVLGSL